MNIDFTRLPETLDVLHLILGVSVVVLLFLQVLVLTLTVIVLLRRSAPPREKALPPPVEVKKPEPSAIPPLAKVEEKPAPPPTPIVLREPTPEAALQLLALFQSEGRLLDFLAEDISAYSDAEVGAAARIVHEGCRKALKTHFKIVPVMSEAEGTRITVAQGFDPSEIRLTGNIVGSPPFSGILVHRGWRATEVKLPKLTEGHRVDILAPAEVEL
jgi:hypothetical protein